jgi:hypothetical protein
MYAEVISPIRDIEVIAQGHGIRELARLKKAYGGKRWRKLKGCTTVNLRGEPVEAEVHWYECHGIGRKETRMIRVLK